MKTRLSSSRANDWRSAHLCFAADGRTSRAPIYIYILVKVDASCVTYDPTHIYDARFGECTMDDFTPEAHVTESLNTNTDISEWTTDETTPEVRETEHLNTNADDSVLVDYAYDDHVRCRTSVTVG